MARLFLPVIFVVTETFTKPVTVGLTPLEFKDLGMSNGLPTEALVKREFVVQEDCSAVVTNASVKFPKGKRVKDVKLAFSLIKQDKPVLIMDTLALTKGMELPEVIGKAVAEIYPKMVEEQMVKDAAPEDSEEDDDDDDDVTPAKPPAVTPAKPAAAKPAAAKAGQ